MVAIAIDAVIVNGPLVLVRGVLRRFAGEGGEGREMGRHGLVAQGWGAGRAGAIALLALEVLWTEGGQCGIDAGRR